MSMYCKSIVSQVKALVWRCSHIWHRMHQIRLSFPKTVKLCTLSKNCHKNNCQAYGTLLLHNRTAAGRDPLQLQVPQYNHKSNYNRETKTKTKDNKYQAATEFGTGMAVNA